VGEAVARNRQFIQADPETVFAVLSDPSSYGEWVVGSKHIRDADEGFPGQGTRLHHTVGWGPIEIDDHTEVREVDPPRLLKLRARARPAGTAIVTLELTPEGPGTMVTMTEDPGDSATAFLFQPPMHLLVRRRNSESLRRLRELAERRRDELPDGTVPMETAAAQADHPDP
jgi:uncharacterized protein YndB with AHSA1/START domain